MVNHFFPSFLLPLYADIQENIDEIIYIWRFRQEFHFIKVQDFIFFLRWVGKLALNKPFVEIYNK